MHLAEIRIENFRLFGAGDSALVFPFQAGLNALVGENDSGKTAIVDAIRFALGTTSQDFQRVANVSRLADHLIRENEGVKPDSGGLYFGP